jgi:hypothetical protein
MSFIVTGFALLLALLAGISGDNVGARWRQTSRRALPRSASDFACQWHPI